MILDEKITKAFDEFSNLRFKDGTTKAFYQVVRDLMVEKPEVATSNAGRGINVEFPLPDIENDITMPEVKEPKKVKMAIRLPYIEANGVKYFPEKEEPKCVHITGEWDMPNIMTKTFTRYSHCPLCGEKL